MVGLYMYCTTITRCEAMLLRNLHMTHNSRVNLLSWLMIDFDLIGYMPVERNLVLR